MKTSHSYNQFYIYTGYATELLCDAKDYSQHANKHVSFAIWLILCIIYNNVQFCIYICIYMIQIGFIHINIYPLFLSLSPYI